MNISNLDLNLLNIFSVIYTTRSISHAAEQLDMNQPTVSNALARLRKQMDDPLFVREGRSMVPTPRAKEIIGPVRRALVEIQSISLQEESFDPLEHQRDFRIHMLGTLELGIMPHLINIANQSDKVTFEMQSALMSSPEVAVASGEADLAIALNPITNPELDWEILCDLELVALVRKGHPEIDGELTLEQNSRLGHVIFNREPTKANAGAKAIMDKLVLRKLPRMHPVAKVDRDLTMAIYASITDLIAIVPRVFANSLPEYLNLQVLKSPIPSPGQPICMVWKNTIPPDPGVEWLKEQIRIVTKKLDTDPKL